ncbi:MAG: glycosyl hydrolase [Bacteroidota bacterium]|jgi:photosystem II stability/assembly factor-like uncharacterized protein
MKNTTIILFVAVYITSATFSFAQKKQNEKKENAKEEVKKHAFESESTFSSFQWRPLGPAVTSGRIIDIAVNSKNKSEYYIAAACGGVWKTTNNGITFNPIFDNEVSYSIGCLTIDPENSNVIWVGTGENNNQRSVAYGDGVYKSEDGGKSWKKSGLDKSEHIGKIAIDPNNTDVVFVAAYGPLWSPGGERGIYKTTDGGKTWKQVLNVSENTGFNDVIIDPKHSNIIYAAAHQRRRHEWTYISGGPESAIYKSIDGGTTWNKLSNGLPTGDVGRIGLAMAPSNSDMIYAIIEGNEDSKGVYRSTDRGASWEKRSGWATAGNYYQEIAVNPKNSDIVYSLDTWAQISKDGGKSFSGLGEKNKHVDNHAIYIDPDNTSHMLMGCDGGLYETYDAAATWQYKANLPLTQFYRVWVDNSSPFYFVYGGTQDNNTLGGPSRTVSATGITNADWYVTTGGDGFKTVVDPTDPNIVYSESQYGGLVRFDKRSGETVDIRPVEKAQESANRFNWDAPLLISNFSNKRLYFASQRVYRSDDYGNTWKTISGDLSRGIDRNKLPVMGKVWSMDAVAKNQSTSIYGNLVSLAESPKNENLLFAGSDDGLIHVTTDGSNWTKSEKFPGVPEKTLVQYITPSQHDENIVYAAFNNLRMGDFKPYLLMSNDKGKTWTSISGNLPERGSVYCIAEDHVNKNLLFCGTEFGIYMTLDGGKNWMKFTNGMPINSVRDIAIQKRENDLVVATFGRGFYVMDDYSPLQKMKKEDLDVTAKIFPVKDGIVFNPSYPYGHKGKSFQGASFFQTDNPSIGANFTVYLKDDYKTIKEKRKESEKEKIKNNQPVFYPSPDSIRMEDREESAYVLLSITDDGGNVVRQLRMGAKKGMNRITWDGRHEVTSAVNFYTPNPDNPYEGSDIGPHAIPCKYKAQLILMQNGITQNIGESVEFNLKTLNNLTFPVSNKKEADEFNKMVAEFRRVVQACDNYRGELTNKIKYIKKAIEMKGGESLKLLTDVKKTELALTELEEQFNGDKSMARREFETKPGLNGLIDGIVYGMWSTLQPATNTWRETYDQAGAMFRPMYNNLRSIKSKIESYEKQLEILKAPYTPGRDLPEWNTK